MTRAALTSAAAALAFVGLLITGIADGSWSDFGWSMLMLAVAGATGGIAWAVGRDKLREVDARPSPLLRWFRSLR